MSSSIRRELYAVRWPVIGSMCDAMASRLIELRKLKQLKAGQQMHFKPEFAIAGTPSASATKQQTSAAHQVPASAQIPSSSTSSSSSAAAAAQQTTSKVALSGVCQLPSSLNAAIAAAAQAKQGSSKQSPSSDCHPPDKPKSGSPPATATAAAAPSLTCRAAAGKAAPVATSACTIPIRNQAPVLANADVDAVLEREPDLNGPALAKDACILQTLPAASEEGSALSTGCESPIEPLHHRVPDKPASASSEACTQTLPVPVFADEPSQPKAPEGQASSLPRQRSSTTPMQRRNRGFHLKTRISWQPVGYSSARTLCLPSVKSGRTPPCRKSGVTIIPLSQKEAFARIDGRAPSQQAAASAKLQVTRAMQSGGSLRGMPAWLRTILTSDSQAVMPNQPENIILTKSDLTSMMCSVAQFARGYEADAETPGRDETGKLVASYAQEFLLQAQGKKQLQTSAPDHLPASDTGDRNNPMPGPTSSANADPAAGQSAAAANSKTHDTIGSAQQPDGKLVASTDSPPAASAARCRELRSCILGPRPAIRQSFAAAGNQVRHRRCFKPCLSSSCCRTQICLEAWLPAEALKWTATAGQQRHAGRYTRYCFRSGSLISRYSLSC